MTCETCSLFSLLNAIFRILYCYYYCYIYLVFYRCLALMIFGCQCAVKHTLIHSLSGHNPHQSNLNADLSLTVLADLFLQENKIQFQSEISPLPFDVPLRQHMGHFQTDSLSTDWCKTLKKNIPHK